MAPARRPLTSAFGRAHHTHRGRHQCATCRNPRGGCMGINRRDLELMVQLAENGYIAPNTRIVEIGAQQLSNNFLRSPDVVRKAEALFHSPRQYALPEIGEPPPEDIELQQ